MLIAILNFSASIAVSQPRIAPLRPNLLQRNIEERNLINAPVSAIARPVNRLSNSAKLNIIRNAGINADANSLGAPVTIDIRHMGQADLYGLNLSDASTVSTGQNVAYLHPKNENQIPSGEALVWFKPIPSKGYVLNCEVDGGGTYNMRVVGGANAEQSANNNLISVFIQPNPATTNRTIYISAREGHYWGKWMLMGCEITPVSM